jgi:GNAT superfamily N-acetyltransferase
MTTDEFFERHAAIVTLGDGTDIEVRPIRPTDKEALVEGLALLSPESRYRRFFTPMERLTQRELAYLTEVDYQDHFAWVALEHPQPDDRPGGIGVARYIRLRDEPTVAEAAVTVMDSWQGRGVGTILLELLAQSALQNGIATFRGYLLRENDRLRRRLQRDSVRFRETDRVLEIDVDLPPTSALAGSALLEVLKEVAAGRVKLDREGPVDHGEE